MSVVSTRCFAAVGKSPAGEGMLQRVGVGVGAAAFPLPAQAEQHSSYQRVEIRTQSKYGGS